MKERPILFSGAMVRAILDGSKTQTRRVVRMTKHGTIPETCPYEIGMRLWVRETWRAYQPKTEKFGGTSAFAGATFHIYAEPPIQGESIIKYRADVDPAKDFITWKSSLHMPRWASRITLEITDVRMERVQDISEVDAEAEGAVFHDGYTGTADDWDGSYRTAFRFLWESIHGAGAWERNPFVWAISFRVIETGKAGGK